MFDFIDFTIAKNADLIILGDFFELWKYKPANVLAKRKKLLDQLTRLNTTYVPGNHDCQFLDSEKYKPAEIHEFFKCTKISLTKNFGSKCYKFMHGHEVDPLMPNFLLNYGQMFGTLAGALDFKSQSCILSNDWISDMLLEVGEIFLSVSQFFASRIGVAFKEWYPYLPAEKLNIAQRSLRTRKMLTRYYMDLSFGLYDKAIVAHTHKAGRFDNWYYNSGSWTGNTNNFLSISTDGEISVFNWTKGGAVENNTLITG